MTKMTKMRILLLPVKAKMNTNTNPHKNTGLTEKKTNKNMDWTGLDWTGLTEDRIAKIR